ncbi:MAG: alkane 1-monooxygenase [Flavobacteriales bacterium]|nr:alkane 1-monooxygenase [Flavobacteriales bacterium]
MTTTPTSILTSTAVQRAARNRSYRYLLTLVGPAFGLVGLLGHGPWCWLFPLYGFAVVPIADLLLPQSHDRFSKEEEEAALNEPLFDWIVYAIVPIQWGLLVLFFSTIGETGLTNWEIAGRIATMGLLCGVYGINVAHELGHRSKRWERDLSRALLLTSLYMHFIIEHNRGHHRHVATRQDPASARRGEPLYFFWVRTIIYSWFSAWHLERERLAKAGRSVWNMENEMLRFVFLQTALCATVLFVFGWFTLVAFLLAAAIGVLLLETVNYIEHYGLQRVKRADGNFGRVHHVHSWNSDHPMGRLMLFELTRHSDHHHKASKKYQALEGLEDGAQLPTGYPGMMILSLLPPVWFRIMHPRVDALKDKHAELA